MKTRLGFVSNSSSASYYITLKEPRKEALSTILTECSWPYFQRNTILEQINKNIKSLTERLEYMERVKESWLIESKEYIEQKLKEFEDMKLQVEEIFRKKDEEWNSVAKDNDLLDIVLKLNYIKIDHETEHEIELSANTVIHNNYVESMSDLLKDIVLYYTFEKPSKISLKVVHDG